MTLMVLVQTCMVFGCASVAGEAWCSHSGDRQWIVEWVVCPDHWARLDAGEKRAPDYQTAPTWRRWIIMGSDLVQEVTPADRWRRDERRRRPPHFEVVATSAALAP
jgi:hypothetical protein